MSSAVSPLAPAAFPDLPTVDGVRFATAAAGIRYKGRRDVMLAVLDAGTEAAGVFTRSKCPSAPVDWCREALKGGKVRGLVVNSGNANRLHGPAGGRGRAEDGRDRRPGHRLLAGEIVIASTGSSANAGRLQVRGVLEGVRRPRGARRMGGYRPGHHDHGHVPEGRGRDGRDRRRPRAHRGRGQGRGQ